MVILFRNRILRRKPEILLRIKCIIKAASRKALNRSDPDCASPEARPDHLNSKIVSLFVVTVLCR